MKALFVIYYPQVVDGAINHHNPFAKVIFDYQIPPQSNVTIKPEVYPIELGDQHMSAVTYLMVLEQLQSNGNGSNGMSVGIVVAKLVLDVINTNSKEAHRWVEAVNCLALKRQGESKIPPLLLHPILQPHLVNLLDQLVLAVQEQVIPKISREHFHEIINKLLT